MAHHRCDVFSKEAVLPGRIDAEMGTANLLHASAQYSENNGRFDSDLNFTSIFNPKLQGHLPPDLRV